MTVDQFVEKYLGKKIDFDGAYGGQCVDLFRQYVKEVLELPQPKGVNGAAEFWTGYDNDPNLKNNYEKIANTPTGVPQKGDVMLWNKKAGGGFGHVSVFLSGNVDTFVSFDQNWPTLSVCTKTNHNYTNVYGWLRAKKKEVTPPPQPPPNPADPRDEQIAQLKAEVANLRLTVTEREDALTEVRKQLSDAVATNAKHIKDFVETLASLLGTVIGTSPEQGIPDIVAAVKRLLSVEDQLKGTEKKLDEEKGKHAAEVAALHGEVSQLRKEIEQQQAELSKQYQENKNLLARVESLERKGEAIRENTKTLSWIDELMQNLKVIFDKKGK
jgi:Skp family chaperone for outer membrane proteins